MSLAHQNRSANRNQLDENRPYAVLIEDEYQPNGNVEPVLTVFLTNRECPFACRFCDLWRNTLETTVAPGAVVRQIEAAIAFGNERHRNKPPRIVKLYNSGNFFDRKAIPPQDLPAIAARLAPFDRVIVENHPKLLGRDVLAFRDRLAGKLEVAMGLEVWDDDLLAKYEKEMTRDDFEKGVAFLTSHDIDVRTFVLAPPPLVDSPVTAAGLVVASASMAWHMGVNAVAIVPLRPDVLDAREQDATLVPTLPLVETAFEVSMAIRQSIFPNQRLFLDLWDMPRLARCDVCRSSRVARLETMNRTQRIAPRNDCDCDRGEYDTLQERLRNA